MKKSIVEEITNQRLLKVASVQAIYVRFRLIAFETMRLDTFVSICLHFNHYDNIEWSIMPVQCLQTIQFINWIGKRKIKWFDFNYLIATVETFDLSSTQWHASVCMHTHRIIIIWLRAIFYIVMKSLVDCKKTTEQRLRLELPSRLPDCRAPPLNKSKIVDTWLHCFIYAFSVWFCKAHSLRPLSDTILNMLSAS